VADNGYEYDYDEPATQVQQRKRGLDVFTLIIGLATLLVSAYALTDGVSWMPTFDLRWILAGGAVLVGVMMLAASFRGHRKP
jgi:fatty acid desaturase